MNENLERIKAVKYIRAMNVSNHRNLIWWTFNFTAKNPLSSPLIKNLIRKLTRSENNCFINVHFIFFAKMIAFVRLILLFLEKNYYFRRKNVGIPKILVLSFLDGQKELDIDTYFGDLRTKISEKFSPKDISFIYHCYRPYSKFINVLLNNNDIHLISMLSFKDFLWIAQQLIKLDINTFDIPQSIDLIVKKEMLKEIRTTFIYNLTVYRAFFSMKPSNVSYIIYPFENKSVEKMLLLGLDNKIKSIGYQHSSISLGHYNFIFSKAEQKITPLPTKIISCGSITRKFLITYGNLNSSKLKKGCELRNSFNLRKRKAIKKFGPYKLLFCFSSSYEEISKAIEILKTKFTKNDFLYITFRFHINFPLEGLQKTDKQWIFANARVSLNKNLKVDIENTDIVGYVSSSVSIIALKYGIPVIQIYPTSPLSDPLFDDKIPNRFFLKEANLIQTVKKITESKTTEIQNGIDYASEYFTRPTNTLIKEFYSAH